MSSICGFFYTDGTPASANKINGMVKALNHWQADDTGIWHNGSVALGHLMLYTTPESLNEKLPFNDHESRLTITADARIDNREELYVKLDIPKSEREKISDSSLILRAYQKWGVDTPKHLLGDFAFAIWDTRNRFIFCARDHVGIKPFYYYNKDNVFAFATEMKGILSINEIDKSISEQWIADYLCSVIPDRIGTMYNKIFRLEGAHALMVSSNNMQKFKYWQPDPSKNLCLNTEEDYISGFREKLFTAIKSRLRSCNPIGSELSGGLDSSAVSSIAHKLLKEQGIELTTISDIYPDCLPSSFSTFINDKPDILSVIKHSGINNAFFVTGTEKGLLKTFNDALKFHDEPPKKSASIFSDLKFEEANKKGIRIMLSGFGGDDMVTSKVKGYHEELLYQGKLDSLWNELKCYSKLCDGNPFRMLITLLLRESLESIGVNCYKLRLRIKGKKRMIDQKFEGRALKCELTERFKTRKRYFRAFNTSFKGSVNQRLIQMMLHPETLSIRLEYCTIAATARRLEYRYPLLDVPLMEYYLALPSHLKRHNGWGRYIFRRAIEGIVPRHIQWKKEKGGSNIPSGIFRKDRDWNLLLHFFENIPPESKIHEYADIPRQIERIKKYADNKEMRNYGGVRIYFLERKLKTLFS